jgi:hypothetical protein
VFRQAGFTTEETDPVWIYKAFKDDVMVDVIFMVMGGIYLDDQMLARSIERDYEGLRREYLLRRGRVGARRMLALLIYAQSSDILVPDWVIRRLYDEIYAQ